MLLRVKSRVLQNLAHIADGLTSFVSYAPLLASAGLRERADRRCSNGGASQGYG